MANWNVPALLAEDRDHLLHPLYHPADHAAPHIWVKGEGMVLTDAEGREFLDGLSCLWNVNVGHGRTELAEAAAAQMATLAYATNYVGSSNVPAIQLAERLTELAYPNLCATFFASGGGEANESAFKTARFYWKAKGRPEKVKVISRQHAYHGVTLATMSATAVAGYTKMFEPRVPNFIHTATPYPYRFEGARAGRDRGAGRGADAGGDDPPGGPRDRGRLHRRARAGGGRGHRPPGRLLPPHPPALHQARRALHRR